MRFMQSDEPSFVHIALWIMSQFSNGGKSHVVVFNYKALSLSLSLPFSPATPDTKTKAALRRSALLNKVDLLRSSRNSVEVTQLAETTLNNLKVTQ